MSGKRKFMEVDGERSGKRRPQGDGRFRQSLVLRSRDISPTICSGVTSDSESAVTSTCSSHSSLSISHNSGHSVESDGRLDNGSVAVTSDNGSELSDASDQNSYNDGAVNYCSEDGSNDDDGSVRVPSGSADEASTFKDLDDFTYDPNVLSENEHSLRKVFEWLSKNNFARSKADSIISCASDDSCFESSLNEHFLFDQIPKAKSTIPCSMDIQDYFFPSLDDRELLEQIGPGAVLDHFVMF